MIFRNLRESVAALKCHDLTPTTCEAVTLEGVVVHVAEDVSALRAEIDELRADVDRLSDDLKEAERTADKWEAIVREQEAAQDEARELAQDPAAIAGLRAELERAHETLLRWQEANRELAAELEVIRKRKGLPALYVSMHQEICAALHDCPADWAQALVRKLHGR